MVKSYGMRRVVVVVHVILVSASFSSFYGDFAQPWGFVETGDFDLD